MHKIYKIKPSLLSSYGTKCEHCLWMSVREVWGQKSLNLRMSGHLSTQTENLLNGKRTELADLLRKHGGKTGEELKAEEK